MHIPGQVRTDPTLHISLLWTSQHSAQSDQTWRLNDPRQTICERRLYRAALSWLIINLSLYLDSAALHFIFVHTAHLGQHTEITLQGVLDRNYTLRLFIENEALELQTQDNRTWTLAQRPYVPYFPITHTR